MSFRINTNTQALSAYRNLSMTGKDLAQSLNRLSTGLRINSGADDPAGLIASERFRVQISAMDAAIRNNSDALNYAKTADSALDEVSRLLKEARSLAVANGNSSIDASQKQANQTQLDSILASVTRVSQTTQFGQKKMLDGSAGAYATVNNPTNIKSVNVTGTFGSVGMDTNGDLDVQVTTAATRAVVTGTQAYATGATLVGAGNFSINGRAFSTTATTDRDALVAMINTAQGETGVTASVNGSNQVVLTTDAYGTDSEVNLTSSTAGLILSAAGSLSDAGSNAVATVTYDYGTGTEAVTFDQGQGLTLKDTNGNQIKLTVAGNATATYTGAVQITAGESKFQIGANGGQTARLNLQNFGSAALGLSGLDITGSDMTAALASLDSAIDTVTSSRGTIGSFMRNTIESNMRSLSVSKENLAATESSIREVDVAEEMTNFTRLQILQQSGVAMLAQANAFPQAVLSLLR
ncbi:MAG: flagellin [Fimbriimonadaceae bacterium]